MTTTHIQRTNTTHTQRIRHPKVTPQTPPELRHFFGRFKDLLPEPYATQEQEDALVQQILHEAGAFPEARRDVAVGELIQGYYNGLNALTTFYEQVNELFRAVFHATTSCSVERPSAGWPAPPWDRVKKARQDFIDQQVAVFSFQAEQQTQLPMTVIVDRHALTSLLRGELNKRARTLAKAVFDAMRRGVIEGIFGVNLWHSEHVMEYSFVENHFQLCEQKQRYRSKLFQRRGWRYSIRHSTQTTIHAIVEPQCEPLPDEPNTTFAQAESVWGAIPAFLKRTPGLVQLVSGPLVRGTVIRREVATDTFTEVPKPQIVHPDPAITFGNHTVLFGWEQTGTTHRGLSAKVRSAYP